MLVDDVRRDDQVRTFAGLLRPFHGVKPNAHDVAAFQPFQNFSLRWPGVRLDKLQCAGNSVEPRFDRRIADAEDLLHLLDRTVRPNEGGDKDLVIGAETSQIRQLERSFDQDVLLG